MHLMRNSCLEDNRLWDLCCKTARQKAEHCRRCVLNTDNERSSKDMPSLLATSRRTVLIIDVIRHSSVWNDQKRLWKRDEIWISWRSQRNFAAGDWIEESIDFMIALRNQIEISWENVIHQTISERNVVGTKFPSNPLDFYYTAERAERLPISSRAESAVRKLTFRSNHNYRSTKLN